MKRILFSIVALAALLWACTPKTVQQTSATPAPSVGKAPVIPLPGGDVRKTAPAPGAAPKVQIGKAETFQLKNGLTVIVVENHKLPQVSFRVFVDYDPVLEQEAVGYVQMTGALLSKGTKTRTKAQIDESVDFIGAYMSSDPNGVSGSSLSKHADKLLTVMSDVLLHPSFPQEEFDKAKKQMEGDLAASKDNADAIAGNVGSVLRYGAKHPYGEVMTEASLEKVSLDQVKKHYATYFKPNISYLVVVGDVTKAQAEQYAEQYFGSWKSGKVPSNKYEMPAAPERMTAAFVHKPGAVQSNIQITYPVDLKPGTPEAIRARVMNAILGGYFNSRVNANLREGHGYTYGAFTALSNDILVGSFTASASVRNTVTDSAIVEFLKEMNRMRTELVPAEELQVVKNVLTGQFSQSLEQPGTVAQFALSTARYKLPADFYEKYLEVLQSVTPEEVLAMAQKYIHPDRAHVLVVGNRDQVADKLKPFAADGEIHFYDNYGNPEQKPTATVPANMTAEKVVEKYLEAIGGMDKIRALKDMSSTAVMDAGGAEIQIKTLQKGDKKAVVEVSMGGQILSKQVCDGVNAKEYGMQGARTLEGEELMDAVERTRIIKEAYYLSPDYKLSLKGIQVLNGANVYIVEVTRKDGKLSTEYYDMATGLKLREMTMQPGQDGEPVAVLNDMKDYKPVNGVLFPFQLEIGGIAPVPLKAVMKELKVNTGMDDALFKME